MFGNVALIYFTKSCKFVFFIGSAFFHQILDVSLSTSFIRSANWMRNDFYLRKNCLLKGKAEIGQALFLLKLMMEGFLLGQTAQWAYIINMKSFLSH